MNFAMLERSSEFISRSNSKGFPTGREAYRSLQSISNLTKNSLGNSESLGSLESSWSEENSVLSKLPNLSTLSKLFSDGGLD